MVGKSPDRAQPSVRLSSSEDLGGRHPLEVGFLPVCATLFEAKMALLLHCPIGIKFIFKKRFSDHKYPSWLLGHEAFVSASSDQGRKKAVFKLAYIESAILYRRALLHKDGHQCVTRPTSHLYFLVLSH